MPLDQAYPCSLSLLSKYKREGPPPFHHSVSTVHWAFGIIHFQSWQRKARLLHWQTEVQGQEWSKVLKTLIFFFFLLFPDLFYTIVYPRLCCGERWWVCWTEMLFSKVHGISDPESQPKLCNVPWLQGMNRAFFQVRHFGTCLCFLCFPVKTRLPPTSTSAAVSWEHGLKAGQGK